MFVKLAVRDVMIIVLGVALWRFAGHWSAGDGMLADFTGLLLGLLVGVGGYLLHEWGHLTGALVTGSRKNFKLI